jgi:hypothetical protein
VLAISGLLRGFNTCCLRFKSGVAITYAKLASGWLARLYREGVEPSGSLQKILWGRRRDSFKIVASINAH